MLSLRVPQKPQESDIFLQPGCNFCGSLCPGFAMWSILWWFLWRGCSLVPSAIGQWTHGEFKLIFTVHRWRLRNEHLYVFGQCYNWSHAHCIECIVHSSSLYDILILIWIIKSGRLEFILVTHSSLFDSALNIKFTEDTFYCHIAWHLKVTAKEGFLPSFINFRYKITQCLLRDYFLKLAALVMD